MRRLWRHDPFAHCALSAPSPLLFAPSCHRPAISPRHLRPLKRPQPRFAWPLSASRESVIDYLFGEVLPLTMARFARPRPSPPCSFLLAPSSLRVGFSSWAGCDDIWLIDLTNVSLPLYRWANAVPVGGFFISLRAGRACPALGGLRMMFWCWPLRGMPRTPLAGARAARTPLYWSRCLGEYPDNKKAALRRLFCHCSSDSGMLFSSGG